MLRFFVLIVFLFISSSYADETAKVLLVRGTVTKLLPGTLHASTVKRGDLLTEDTSVVTGEKSFVRLRFSDNSTMNVAPKSKIVIDKLPEKKANMVNLLTGMLKAEVKKKTKKKTKTKLIVKTRSAVMGVRGTKFQAMYNSQNKATSLVTVEGQVAMVDEREISKLVKKASQLESKSSVKVETVDTIDRAFEESRSVVEVPAGRYSGVSRKVRKPSRPVKIAPRQYNAIAKSMGSKNKADDVMGAEGVIGKSTNPASFKSGGIVDFKTGLYVAPDSSSSLDPKTGTYIVSSQVGEIDELTGDYIPPKGIKIDAKKGFVLDVANSADIATADRENLQNTIQKMNKTAEKQIIVNKNEAKSIQNSFFSWLPQSHFLTIELRPYSQELTVENKGSNSKAEFYTESASWTIFTWNQAWSSIWSSRIRLGKHSYDIDQSGLNVYEYGDDDEDDGFFSLGAAYKYSQKLQLTLDLVKRSQFYVVPTSGQSGSGVRVTSREIDSIDLGAIYKITRFKGFDFSAQGAIYFIGDSEIPSLNAQGDSSDELSSDESFGFSLSGDARYKWSETVFLDSRLWFERMEAENETLKFSRNSLGFGLNLIWNL